MMKKMIAGLLVSGMLFSTVPAFAGETEASKPVEVNWSDIVEQLEAVGSDVISQGEFYTFDEVAAMMWVPNGLTPQELTDEDVENGMIAYFSTDEGDAAASVVYVDADGIDLEGYKESLAEDEEVSDLSDAIFNGIPCIGYDLVDRDTRCIAFETVDGHILEFSFAPVSDEDYSSVMTMMMASIQPEQEAETEA